MIYGNMFLNERYILNVKDLYYNKDKFDSGKTNICFITGHSGSGKTTISTNMGTENVYSLDDVITNKNNFTMGELKEYGNLIYSFFNGIGKKYYLNNEERKEQYKSPFKYYKELLVQFVSYSMSYAKTHKNDKFVIEGIQLYCYFKPEFFKDCAFYIKGTSALISTIRACKRNNNDKNLKDKFEDIIKGRKRYIEFFLDEKYIKEFVDYFSKLESDNN